jgi:hypothetical protein
VPECELNNQEDNSAYIAICRERLLKDPDKICDRLNVVDKHMQSYDQKHQVVLLPSGYEFLQPLATAFVRDLGGFVEFLRGLRDCFDRRSRQFVDLQALYRRTNGRHVQQQRRERSTRATQKAEQMWGPLPYTKRIQWIADLEHEWAARRLEFLTSERRRSGEDHLPRDNRTEALLEFWEIIDTEIHEGRLPKWN